jgi:cytosine deaminase
MIPSRGPYRLARVHVPHCLIEGASLPPGQNLALVDLDVTDDRIAGIAPAGTTTVPATRIDAGGRMVLPCFADLHTHIDKGHIWDRAQGQDGTHHGALMAVGADRAANWAAEDVAARMDFSLRCAYAHGTAAIRTHLDSLPPQAAISWPVFARMRDAWAGRLALQAVSIVPLDLFRNADDGRALADIVAKHDGLLGAVLLTPEDIGDLLDRIFTLARERNLDIDFHVDETLDPSVRCLAQVAAATLKFSYEGRVTVGHCCSLTVLPDDVKVATAAAVAKAGLTVVSLPMCNLYLQDRAPGVTPHQRGLTALHELKAAGAAVAIASDNTRDPFYAYGDLDMFEVLRECIRIGQLDHPIGDWPAAFTAVPTRAMGVDAGVLRPGAPADFILFEGRRWSELLARPEHRRIVVRNGRAIDAAPPAFAELDHLSGLGLRA